MTGNCQRPGWISPSALNRLYHSLVAACLAVFSTALPADHILPDFRAEYLVLRNNSEVGIRTHTLARQQGHYLYEGRMHTTGLASWFKPGEIVERSEWKLLNNRVIPQRYDYLDNSDSNRSLRLQFNWGDHTVTNDVGNHPWRMDVPDGTQDKFGYLLSLMRDLEHGVTDPTYRIADGGRLKTYRFSLVGNEQITTPAGKFNAVHYQRTRKGKPGRHTDIWCLPGKHYLPIKIERHRGDNTFTMVLKRIEGI